MSVLIVTTGNTMKLVDTGDVLKLRGIASEMQITAIDKDLISFRRLYKGELEGGTPFRIHADDVAVEAVIR